MASLSSLFSENFFQWKALSRSPETDEFVSVENRTWNLRIPTTKASKPPYLYFSWVCTKLFLVLFFGISETTTIFIGGDVDSL
jgi:hypothetical protein